MSLPLAGSLMTAAVPRGKPTETVSEALAALQKQRLEEASHFYLIDQQRRLIGQVPVEALLSAAPEVQLGGLCGTAPIKVSPEANAETVALLAVERHDADVAVIDPEGRLLGAIPIGRLLALLHDEHVDDFLRMGGVALSHPVPPDQDGTLKAVHARLPWLLVGLLGGFFAGGVASLFETPLKDEIALAFFLPLVVYMADAVGTQTETVLVRALAYGRFPLWPQMLREARIGGVIGLAIGVTSGLGLLLWSGRVHLSIVIALTLASTSVIATLVATVLPIGLSRLGADPALASGPMATVVQDILSVAVYLGIAMLLL